MPYIVHCRLDRDGRFEVSAPGESLFDSIGSGSELSLREGRSGLQLRRILKQGGKLMIADIRHTGAYARELERCGLKITDRRSLGVRFWYAAGPWAATRLVAVIKP